MMITAEVLTRMDTGKTPLLLKSTIDGKRMIEWSDRWMVLFGTSFDMSACMKRITDDELMSSDCPTVKCRDKASMVADTMASTEAVTMPSACLW